MDLSLLAFDPGKPGGIIRWMRGKRLDNGGVQFTGTKETKEFSYSDAGLQQLSSQQLQQEGREYQIEYSQHTWSKDHRPTGFTARIVGVSDVEQIK